MTKILISAVAIFSSIALVGCNKTLDFRNADVSNNKIYESGGNTGFTGKVTNIPLNKIPFGNLVPVTNMIGQATGNKNINDYIYLNSLPVVNDGGVLCDTSANDGMLNGETLCKIAASNTPMFKLTFKNNLIDGKVTFFYLQKSGQLFAEANYTDGQPNGKMTIYGIGTGKPIYKVDWLNGAVTGEEEGIDENNGKLTFKAKVVNGNRDGDFIRYGSNGEIAQKIVFNNGIQVQSTQAMTAQNAAPQDCVDSWIAAFRKEQGAESAVSADQIKEWENWCSQGKKPQS
jgi:hypothetical protein